MVVPFAVFHPALVLAYFIGAVILCVLVNNPVFQLVGLICAAACYLCVCERKGWKVVAGMMPVLVVLAAINPLLNTRGATVLFTWIWGRPYTLEALVYGVSVGLMFVTVLLWFFSFNKVMTSDRLTYLFGRLAPGLTLVFTMVLRALPTYQCKVKEIAAARAGVGRSVSEGTLSKRVRSGTTLLSSLTSWALEGSIITADSMRSRGFGAGKRTSYVSYVFTTRDVIALVVGVVLFALALKGVLSGVTAMEFFPFLVYPNMDTWGFSGLIGCIAFVLYLFLPTLTWLGEVISWKLSLSKI